MDEIIKDYSNIKKDISELKKINNKDMEDHIYWLPRNNNNCNITIYDNILTKEISNFIYDNCKKMKWSFCQKSITQANNIYKNIHNYLNNQWPDISFTFFKSDVINNRFFNDLFYDTILPKVDCIKDKKNVTISRMYFNTHTPGICGSWHKDGKTVCQIPLKNNAPTILLYFNNDWSVNYDGSTSFLIDDTNHDNIIHINMKHGRIVVFPSYISHKMNDVSYYTLKHNCLRFVVAYHLQGQY